MSSPAAHAKHELDELMLVGLQPMIVETEERDVELEKQRRLSICGHGELLGQSSKYASVPFMSRSYDLLELAGAGVGANGRDHDGAPIGRDLEFGLGVDVELVEQPLI